MTLTTTDRVVLELVRAGRVSQRRDVAPPSAPSFYRHQWLVDGAPAQGRVRNTLTKLYADERIDVGDFGVGPGTRLVTERVSVAS